MKFDTKPLTEKTAHKYFRYEPETGLIYWREDCGGRAAGKLAGTKTPYRYIYISLFRVKYAAHHIAWLLYYGDWPCDTDHEIDHINHERGDNRITNLRVVTRQENARNASMPKNNMSGVCGVNWHGPRKKWLARIKVDYRTIHIGIYEDWFDAVCARKDAERKYGFHTNHGVSRE